MKRNLLFIVFLFINICCYSQRYNNPNPGAYGFEYNRVKADSTLILPTGCGVPTDSSFLHDKTFRSTRMAAKYYDSCGHKEYLWDPSLMAWQLSGGGGNGLDSTAWHIGGDSTTNQAILGTKTNRSLYFMTNNIPAWRIDSNYTFGVSNTGFSSYNTWMDYVGDAYFSQSLQAGSVYPISFLGLPDTSHYYLHPLLGSHNGNLFFQPYNGYFRQVLTSSDSALFVTQNQLTNYPTTSSVNISLAAKEPTITPSNTVKQYWNGYKSFVNFTTDSIPQGTTNKYFVTGDTLGLANKVNKSDSSLRTGYVTPTVLSNDSTVLANLANSKQPTITLTTTGTSGAATFSSNTLNVPNYTYTQPSTNTNNYDTIPLAAFTAGSGAAGDTSAFSTTALYGSFYNSGSDTLVITSLIGVCQGTSPSVTVTAYYGSNLNSSGTAINSGGTSVTSTTVGNSVTLSSIKIPPSEWVWCQTTTVTTKPTYLSVTLIGYKKHV